MASSGVRLTWLRFTHITDNQVQGVGESVRKGLGIETHFEIMGTGKGDKLFLQMRTLGGGGGWWSRPITLEVLNDSNLYQFAPGRNGLLPWRKTTFDQFQIQKGQLETPSTGPVPA
jgi:hypothetical protein